MITVISGTNRKNSRTSKVAKHIFGLLSDHKKQSSHYLELTDLPEKFVHTMMYETKHQDKGLVKIQDKYFTPADKLIFVVPEYNGSFPGIFKLFIDAISIRNYKENFKDKKVLLVGVASGRAGNLRGMDHLTTSLNYLKMNIFPIRFPIPQIEKRMDGKGKLTDEVLKKELKSIVSDFISF
jgi:NAD(P)H-dependent FMN reductase